MTSKGIVQQIQTFCRPAVESGLIPGSEFREAMRVLRDHMAAGEKLSLVREPYNPYDPNAIAIFNSNGQQLGYIPKKKASRFARRIDRGAEVYAQVSVSVTPVPSLTYRVFAPW